MNYKSEEQFVAELNLAKQKLAEHGVELLSTESPSSEGGMKCDFDLPYSSFPKFYGSKWYKPEKTVR